MNIRKVFFIGVMYFGCIQVQAQEYNDDTPLLTINGKPMITVGSFKQRNSNFSNFLFKLLSSYFKIVPNKNFNSFEELVNQKLLLYYAEKEGLIQLPLYKQALELNIFGLRMLLPIYMNLIEDQGYTFEESVRLLYSEKLDQIKKQCHIVQNLSLIDDLVEKYYLSNQEPPKNMEDFYLQEPLDLDDTYLQQPLLIIDGKTVTKLGEFQTILQMFNLNFNRIKVERMMLGYETEEKEFVKRYSKQLFVKDYLPMRLVLYDQESKGITQLSEYKEKFEEALEIAKFVVTISLLESKNISNISVTEEDEHNFYETYKDQLYVMTPATDDKEVEYYPFDYKRWEIYKKIKEEKMTYAYYEKIRQLKEQYHVVENTKVLNALLQNDSIISKIKDA